MSKDEQDYIDDVSSTFDMSTLKKVNEDKINAIENIEEWLKANGNSISQYEVYKNSEEYQNSLMKQIQDKLKKFMEDNTKEKSSLVSRNRKNERKEIDGFMKKEQSLKVSLLKARILPKTNFIS